MPVAGQGIACPEVRRAGHSVGGRGRAWMDRVGDEVLVKRVASGDEHDRDPRASDAKILSGELH